MSLQWTALVNGARRVLQDPVRRARWLATGSAEPGEKGAALDPEFLQEMFSWRELDEESPGALRAKANARHAEIMQELESLFSAWELGEGDLRSVEDRLARLKYVDGLAGAEH